MSARASLLAGANLIELSPQHVDEGDRIGFLHEDKAAALGRLIAVDGQRDPIKVVANDANPDKPWRLVTGMHRLIGTRIECITVWAIEVSGTPEELADLEASENLHRRPLAPIERAKFTAALVQAAQERIAREHGELSHQKLGAKLRWQRVRDGESRAAEVLTEESEDACAKIAQAYGWEESVGEALGMSRRSIHNDLQLSRLLIEPFPEFAEALSKHPVVGENASQLRELAQVRDEALRRKAIEALLEDDTLSAEMACAAAGIDRAKGPAPSPEQKAMSAVIGNLSRLSAASQKHNLDGIIRALKSDEVKRQLRDRLNAELGETGAPTEGTVEPAPVAEAPAPTPAIPVRASVKPDYVVCLECGEKVEKLSKHLRETHDTKAHAYLARWRLPADYPMFAPNYQYSDAHKEECTLSEDADNLERMLDHGEDALAEAVKPEDDFGFNGTTRFANGTHELKIGKVKATCTAGGANLVRAWIRAARRRADELGNA